MSRQTEYIYLSSVLLELTYQCRSIKVTSRSFKQWTLCFVYTSTSKMRSPQSTEICVSTNFNAGCPSHITDVPGWNSGRPQEVITICSWNITEPQHMHAFDSDWKKTTAIGYTPLLDPFLISIATRGAWSYFCASQPFLILLHSGFSRHRLHQPD